MVSSDSQLLFHTLGHFSLPFPSTSIVDGNTKTELSNRKEPGVFCGETEQPQTFISETSFVKLVFHVDNFTDQTYFSFDSRAEQQFDVYLRYGQHPELYPNRRGQIALGSYCERTFTDCRLQTCYVQSPAYPGIYPRHLHCTYKLNTRQPFIKLYIENEEFNIDGQRCENIMTCPMRPISSGAEHCPYDYIKIYDGKDASYPVIGTFCGMGKFPYSIIGTSEDLFVEFVSSPAGPLLNTGFHFNVGNWPGHVETAGSRNSTCDWLLTAEDLEKSGDSEGIFLSVAHWYPPHTSCTYLIQGKPNQVVRLYFPSFRINRIESPIAVFDGDCGESLTLYDASWPDDSRIIKTFCDTFSRAMEKHDFVSTGNALFVRFESKTGSYSGSSLYYWAHYDFFNNTKFGTAVPGSSCDEEFSSWKSVKGYLRSPMNTLVYKRPENSGPLTCRYTFVTDRRLYARVILTITSINFKVSEIRVEKSRVNIEITLYI
ncbi:CUB domain [Nesidiocoris tenuis]|uniref:CUB domain n=1 Tax=Nesidiocoris tenuis TaxID=355587 RepID=A0ABN7B831_9HEMI|nr:CUB domain [Nesidiocoris tenuis]